MKTVRTVGAKPQAPQDIAEFPISRKSVARLRNMMTAIFMTAKFGFPILNDGGILHPDYFKFLFFPIQDLIILGIALIVFIFITRYFAKVTFIRVAPDHIEYALGKKNSQKIQFDDVKQIRAVIHTNGTLRSIVLQSKDANMHISGFQNMPQIYERILTSKPITATSDLVPKFRPDLPFLGLMGWLLWAGSVMFLLLATIAIQLTGLQTFIIAIGVGLLLITVYQLRGFWKD